MYKEIETGRSMLYRTCATANPFPDPYLAAVAKIFCNEMSLRVTSEAVQIHGGYGYIDETPVSRYYRDAKILEIGEGTSEIQRLILARGLGLPVE
jgi:alkylation response protein AidB-like acyl-CoA dehydrogenase